VIAVSPRLVDHARRWRVDDERLSYVPNGIDLDEHRRTRTPAAARKALGLHATRPAVVVVGRLSVEKGVDRVVELVHELAAGEGDRAADRHAAFHLVGDGPQRSFLEQRARVLGVADRIHFHGWQSDPRPWIESADVLLLPSRTEGLPNAVLEAMALGTPAAATDVGGGATRDLLDDGACGVVLANTDAVGAWASPLRRLLDRPALRRDLADRARARVEARFSFAHRMQRVFDVYDRLPGIRTRPATAASTPTPARRAA
jgi:glycosyltransferase involved in cell wall biosynthesis